MRNKSFTFAEQQLDDALRRAVEAGISINPSTYGVAIVGKCYEKRGDAEEGGVCAIGAYLIGKEAYTKRSIGYSIEASLHLGVSSSWSRGLNVGFLSGYMRNPDEVRSKNPLSDREDFLDGQDTGARLHKKYVVKKVLEPIP